MLNTAGAQLDYVPNRAVDHIPMPMADALRPVKTASVYQARSRVRFIPTSGQLFGVGAGANGSTSINIVISSPSDWLEMSSATLNFQLTTQYTAGAANDYFGLDDLATSPFQRCRIYGGGTILHDSLYQNVLALAEVYASTPYQVYKSKLGAEAYAWKFNNDNFGGNKNAPGARIAVVSGNAAGTTGVKTVTYDCSIPMSMFSPLFRIDKLFPLRNIGSLNIVLDMDPNLIQNCCFSTLGGTVSNASVVLNGVEFRADLITVSPLVQAMYDQMCASSEGCPLIGFESPTGLVSSYAGSNGSASQKALVYPRVSPSLSHIVTVRRHASPTAVMGATVNGATVVTPLSTFEITGYNAASAVGLQTSNFFAVGSKRVPQDPASVAQAFGNTADAFHARTGGFGSIVDVQNFCGVNNTGSVWDNTAQAQVLAASFELTRDAEIMGTGYNMGGQQLIQYLTTAEVDNLNYNIYAFIFEHKYLRIANNTVYVDTQL